MTATSSAHTLLTYTNDTVWRSRCLFALFVPYEKNATSPFVAVPISTIERKRVAGIYDNLGAAFRVWSVKDSTTTPQEVQCTMPLISLVSREPTKCEYTEHSSLWIFYWESDDELRLLATVHWEGFLRHMASAMLQDSRITSATQFAIESGCQVVHSKLQAGGGTLDSGVALPGSLSIAPFTLSVPGSASKGVAPSVFRVLSIRFSSIAELIGTSLVRGTGDHVEVFEGKEGRVLLLKAEFPGVASALCRGRMAVAYADALRTGGACLDVAMNTSR